MQQKRPEMPPAKQPKKVANDKRQLTKGILSMTDQKLHLVFGGKVSDPQSFDFTNLDNIDLVGVYPNYEEAEDAWRANAQRTVDDAEMKYVLVHLHRLLEPELTKPE